MARNRPTPALLFTPAAAAALLLCTTAQAQSNALAPVTITGRTDPLVSVAGWGDLPLSELPAQASVLTAGQMRDRGLQRLADMVRTDASVGDSYNAEGYWDFISVRGFTLDNRFNIRRDGLPISGETLLPLDNKERLEILKGTSGMQAGTSAPGGLANLVVKRPLQQPLYSAFLGWREHNTVQGAADLSQRFGNGAFGARLNLSYERLDPQLRNAEGRRHLAALATDWRLGSSTLVELEGETSHRSQPSQPGFSMLGSRVPNATDPRVNLNNQPWSQPVVMDGDTASLRITHRFDRFQLSLHGATQRLRTDDRLAFPYGCGAEGNYDRYCSDGTFDLYDFRSENERRRIDSLQASVQGETKLLDMSHRFTAGALQSRVKNRFGPQTYTNSWADAGNTIPGVGNIDGTLVTYPNPTPNATSTDRDEHSNELFVRDTVRLNEHLGLWLGLRHNRLHRSSVQTDGSAGTDYEQSFTTPWLATSYTFAPSQMLYGSWGRGIESDVAPSQPQYTNHGQALPAARSRQLEVGLKVATADANWGFSWFDIKRPLWSDTGLCDGSANSCTRVLDGYAEHQGVEAQAAWRSGAWWFQGSLQALRAARQESTVDPSLNDKKPTNVPLRTAKLQVRYDVPQLPGLSTQVDIRGVSERAVLPDNSASIPGYSVTDLSLKYETQGSTAWVWRLGVDNVFDHRAWRESPFQFGHVYLYPLPGRSVRLSVEARL